MRTARRTMSIIRLLLLAAATIVGTATWSSAAEEDAAADGHAAEAHADDGHADDTAHADDAHAADAHAPSGPLDWKSDLAVWTFVVFVVLLAVLRKFAWGPITAGLDKREQGIADHIAAAENSNTEAKNLLAEYERKLAAAQDEVRAILDEARRDADHTSRDIIAKAQSEATAHRDRTLKDIERAKDGAITELAGKSAELAVDLAGKIVSRQLTAADHAQLIEQSLAKISAGSVSNN